MNLPAIVYNNYEEICQYVLRYGALISLYEIIAIGIGLSMDAFAVSIGCSIALRKVSFRQVFRFSFHFGFRGALRALPGGAAPTPLTGKGGRLGAGELSQMRPAC